MAVYLLFQLVFVWHVAFLFQALAAVVTGGLGAGLGHLYVQTLGQQQHLLVALGVTLPIMLYDLLRFSHRVAGPLYRCAAVMRQMAAGQRVPEFTPRKGDHFREFFETFNALIRTWNARLAADSGDRPAPVVPHANFLREVHEGGAAPDARLPSRPRQTDPLPVAESPGPS
jgi:hypothetical protein